MGVERLGLTVRAGASQGTGTCAGGSVHENDWDDLHPRHGGKVPSPSPTLPRTTYALLFAATAYLFVNDPATKRLFFEDPSPEQKCDENPWRTTCLNDCFGRGQCVEETCVCQEGWTGTDCSSEYCPSDCSGHGHCESGYCMCDPMYGGPDCSIDRLVYLKEALLQDVSTNLEFTNGCEFLTKEALEKGGGDKIMYWSDATGHMESYEIPLEMGSVLPDACPSYKFRTCAVVGNSGTMLFEKFGDDINRHEMVYRFNQAPTRDWEIYVGNHTMFESLNAKFAHQLMRAEPGWKWRDPLAVYIMFEPLKLQEAYVTIRNKYPQLDALLFGPEFFVKAHQIYDQMQMNLERNEFGCFTGEKPMSGFYAVLYALSACEEVDLYGFDPWTDAMARDRSRRNHYHYFNDEQPRTGAHSFDATYYMYRLIEISGQTKLKVHSAKISQDNTLPKDIAHIEEYMHLNIP